LAPTTIAPRCREIAKQGHRDRRGGGGTSLLPKFRGLSVARAGPCSGKSPTGGKTEGTENRPRQQRRPDSGVPTFLGKRAGGQSAGPWVGGGGTKARCWGAGLGFTPKGGRGGDPPHGNPRLGGPGRGPTQAASALIPRATWWSVLGGPPFCGGGKKRWDRSRPPPSRGGGPSTKSWPFDLGEKCVPMVTAFGGTTPTVNKAL